MPDRFIAEDDDWVTVRSPAQSPKQDRVEQADVVAHEKIALPGIKLLEPVRTTKIRKREKQSRAQPQPPLDELETARNLTRRCGGVGSARPGVHFNFVHEPVSASFQCPASR